jgi:hypothetical protein
MNLFSQDTALLKLPFASRTVFCQFALSLNLIDRRGALQLYAIRKIFIVIQNTSSDNIFYTLQRLYKLVFVCNFKKAKICSTRFKSKT